MSSAAILQNQNQAFCPPFTTLGGEADAQPQSSNVDMVLVADKPLYMTEGNEAVVEEHGERFKPNLPARTQESNARPAAEIDLVHRAVKVELILRDIVCVEPPPAARQRLIPRVRSLHENDVVLITAAVQHVVVDLETELSREAHERRRGVLHLPGRSFRIFALIRA